MSGSGRDKGGKFRPGVSGNPNGRTPRGDAKPVERLTQAAASASARYDGWANDLTGLGDLAFDRRMATRHRTNVLSTEQSIDLYRGNDLAATIVDAVVDDGCRRGFDLIIKDDDPTKANPAAPGPAAKAAAEQEGKPGNPFAKVGDKPPGKSGNPFARGDLADYDTEAGGTGETQLDPAAGGTVATEQSAKAPISDRIAAHWKRLRAIATIKQWWKWGRSQGGCAILMGIRGVGQALDKPLNVKNLKGRTLDFLTVLERRELIPVEIYADPLSPKYGQPAIYELNPHVPGQAYNPKAATRIRVRIHESRLIIFNGERVSNGPQGGGEESWGWGDSVFVRVEPVLRDFGVSWDSAAALLQDFAQATMSIEGLAELLAQGRSDVIRDRIKMVNLARSTIRTVVLDKEEVFERKQTPVTGLDALLIQFSERVAAAARMPRTRLMGTSPGGLNATGESDMKQWYDHCDADVADIAVPALERITEVLFALEGETPESWCVEGRPLYRPSDLEAAQARETQSKADVAYITAGVLSPEEVAVARFGSDRYSFETHVDLEAREALEPAAPPPAKTEQQLEQEQADRDMAMKELEIKASAKAPPPGASK